MTVNDVIIRKAVKEDCPQLMDLVRELALYENAPEEVTVSLKEMQEAGFGKSPVWWAIVAELNGKIVGMSLYYIRYSTWKGRRLYLEDLIINEACRGKGIGKRLFEATIQEARRMGMGGMTWQALDWNEPALNFYRKYPADFDEEWINISLEFK